MAGVLSTVPGLAWRMALLVAGPLVVLTATLALGSCADESVTTYEEMCDDLGAAMCSRLVECDPAASYNACFQAGKSGCCIDAGVCDDEVFGMDDPEGYLDRCTEALSTAVCEELQSGIAPAVCLQDCGDFC